ncbi:hypothetical protein [Pseudomonas sp. PSKL.D1]|uniref:hypothetical protein n=1 Tax=Pseudomonas sp. PSKL.D1 TaxID=3029060 RepID=UPI002380D77F|nr:hypothetical protein [Pseudomonas sp. PSKL.D1]WDY60298.1 hypothetical protein PVV54_11945 [Pseudomonas sp. PSKL.D1]
MPPRTTKRPTKPKHPGGAVHDHLVEMDFWVKCAYLFTPAFLALLAGTHAILLAMFIYPVISAVYFILRHRYLKNAPPDLLKHVVPWSHIYEGRSISMIILILWAMACAYGLFNHFR